MPVRQLRLARDGLQLLRKPLKTRICATSVVLLPPLLGSYVASLILSTVAARVAVIQVLLSAHTGQETAHEDADARAKLAGLFH